METKHSLVLSTTDPTNNNSMIKIRQGDIQTQKLVVEITENGQIKSFEGLVPFFINTTKFVENQPVEQKVQSYFPSKGRLIYMMSEPDWQWGGMNTAHFSFRSLSSDGTWNEQFSTQDFTYRVLSGITNTSIRDSAYIWSFEELLRNLREYTAQGKTDWDKWIESNKEILNNIDPGGTIINILNDAKGSYASLADRLNAIQNKLFDFQTGSDQVYSGLSDLRFNLTTGQYEKIIPSNLEAVLNNIQNDKFNVAFVTDTHVDKHVLASEGINPKQFKFSRRWNTIRRFQALGEKCDATVYGGDNADCHSGRINISGDVVVPEGRIHSMALQKRFVGLAKAGKKNVIICRGNHDTGKIPYAWFGHTPETCLNGADMRNLYDGTYGGQLFKNKGLAIYRFDTDDYSDELDEMGYYKEFSGSREGGEAGKISTAQLEDLGTFLMNLERDYHVLLVGHIPLVNSDTGVWNTNMVQQLLDGFKQGIKVTINYDSLKGQPTKGYSGTKTFDFSKRGQGGTIIAYICGHWHYETTRDLGTTKMVVCTCAFPVEDDYESNKYSGFYHLEIDKASRTLKINGIGHCSTSSISY
ncbi:BppU family phage baseplate upper protein [Enterococcus thailandicus]|uniref:BppU family phage baseplate upper protein n=1 Tax=Enterococcus thailandicus TaxID=417368 RepID=UPI0035D57FE4